MILIDTNILVYYLKGVAEVVRKLQSTPRDQLAVSAITLFELEYGTLKAKVSAKRRAVLESGLESVNRIPFDESAALAAARIRVDLEAKGAVIGPMDLLIAGTAVSRRAELATANVSEFVRVRGLRVQNWRLG